MVDEDEYFVPCADSSADFDARRQRAECGLYARLQCKLCNCRLQKSGIEQRAKTTRRRDRRRLSGCAIRYLCEVGRLSGASHGVAPLLDCRRCWRTRFPPARSTGAMELKDCSKRICGRIALHTGSTGWKLAATWPRTCSLGGSLSSILPSTHLICWINS